MSMLLTNEGLIFFWLQGHYARSAEGKCDSLIAPVPKS
jgi:hypothetical protein